MRARATELTMGTSAAAGPRRAWRRGGEGGDFAFLLLVHVTVLTPRPCFLGCTRAMPQLLQSPSPTSLCAHGLLVWLCSYMELAWALCIPSLDLLTVFHRCADRSKDYAPADLSLR